MESESTSCLPVQSSQDILVQFTGMHQPIITNTNHSQSKTFIQHNYFRISGGISSYTNSRSSRPCSISTSLDDDSDPHCNTTACTNSTNLQYCTIANIFFVITIFSHLKLLLEYGASVTVKNKMSLYKGNFDRLLSRLEIHIQTDRLIYFTLFFLLVFYS